MIIATTATMNGVDTSAGTTPGSVVFPNTASSTRKIPTNAATASPSAIQTDAAAETTSRRRPGAGVAVERTDVPGTSVGLVTAGTATCCGAGEGTAVVATAHHGQLLLCPG